MPEATATRKIIRASRITLSTYFLKAPILLDRLIQQRKNHYINEIENLYDQYNQTTDSVERKLIYKKIDSVSGIAAKYALPGEYNKMMTSMGAQGTNAHTSVEETVYEEDIPANAIDKFLALQSERFRNPVFSLFHTELEAVYEEKNRTLDNDGRKAWYALLEGMFPHHNYGQQTTIGTIDHLKNPSLKAIRDFYNKNYVASNMAVIFAGDFNPDDIIKKIDNAFKYCRLQKRMSILDLKKNRPLSQTMKDMVWSGC